MPSPNPAPGPRPPGRAAHALQALRELLARLASKPPARKTPSPLELTRERVRAIVAERRRIGGQDEPALDIPKPLAPVSLPRVSYQAPPIAARDAYGVEELLAFHDEDFLRNAYRALLRREPDPEGFASHRAALHGGETTKVEILAHLRYSDEGRRVGVPVRGLRSAYVLHRLRRVPVLGALAGIALYGLRLPMLVRNMERHEVQLFRRERELRAAIDGLAASTESAAHSLQQSLLHAYELIARLERQKASRRLGESLSARITVMRREVAAIHDRIDEEGVHEELKRVGALALVALQDLDVALAELDRRKADEQETAARFAEAAARAADDEQKTAARFAEAAAHAAAALQDLRDALAELDQRKAGEQETAARFAAATVRAAAAEDRAILLDGRVDTFEREVGRMFTPQRIEAVLNQADPALDDFYAAFEDRFRGSREEIKQRVAIYVPVFQAAAAGSPQAPIVDIGCGRGELLEVVRDAGLVGRGIDFNEGMVQRCLDLGLDVRLGDAVEYLRALEPDSLGAVTGVHVIEHLAFRRMLELFDACLKALKPGGVVIFETPNPENLIVGASGFWFDFTHRAPLQPEAVKFVVEARGFARARIERLHPFPDEFRVKAGAEEVRVRMNDLLYGPQDYSIIAYKP